MEVLPTPRAWSLPRDEQERAEEIVVHEKDYRRYAGDLAMLRRCQIPRWAEQTTLPAVVPRGYADAYEQRCRAVLTELRDPWQSITDIELIRQPGEGDMTLNQVWVPQTPPQPAPQAQ
eukprot:CAMPEP_0179153524 /NCGR_PEP_ID=MMETSP0796-20121207/74663_1 /TAXON_ID=73915 /ORGANISM="Pyrodinium bahamense, Strain pbaha01" /LENGTH=117 /DNA_ID=CAMNT_0020854815 /DNA_START=38 /DNA_END=388 /DNA_ORIENTATION=+